MHAIYATPVISIHAPTRGATYNGAKYFIHCADFNPRSHEGSDKAISCKNKRKCKISIHAPTRGATDINLSGIVATEISIHAPTRGATSCADKHSACSFYFNPRSHEGSDQTALIIARERWIFQSTLPRGERQYFHFCSKMLKKISIHAPTRGATTFPGTFRSTYNYFNPRSHEGSDRK